jgi:8-oxo-dGTP diphosphatase
LIKLAGCIIKDSQGKVLLIHRSDGRYTHWEVPGGKIEPGERPEAAATREMQEELGIRVSIGEKIGEKEFIERGQQLHYSWYSAKTLDSQPKLAEPQIFDELKYFSMAQMHRMFDDLSLGAQNYLSIIKVKES